MTQTTELQGAALRFVTDFFNKAVPLKLLLAIVVMAVLPFVAQHFWPNPSVPLAGEGQGLGVSDLIRKVKRELMEASDSMEKKNEAALFRMKSVDLEVSFVARAQTTTSGRTTYELVTVDNQLQTSSERMQKLMLHMDVVQPEQQRKTIKAGSPNGAPTPTITVDSVPPSKKKGRQ